MSANSKADLLRQRMNRRAPAASTNIDQEIDQKKSIIEEITGEPPVQVAAQEPTHTNGLESDSMTVTESQVTSDTTSNLASDAGSDPAWQIESQETRKIASQLTGISASSTTTQEDIEPIGEGTTQMTNEVVVVPNIISEIAEEFRGKKPKRLTHKKATYELPLDLLDRFDRIAKRYGDPRGFKEKTMQKLLEWYCDQHDVSPKRR